MSPKEPRRRSLLAAWMGVFAWCAVIFYFSSRPDYGPGRELDTVLGALNFAAHKAAHLFVYAVLMFLTRDAVGLSFPKLWRWHFLGSFLLVLAYAASDEWHQSFVFGRTGTVRDVFIDSLGALIGFYYHHRNEKAKPASGESPKVLEDQTIHPDQAQR